MPTCRVYRETLQPSSCLSEWLGRVQLEVLFWSSLGVVYDSDVGPFQGHRTSPAPPSPSLAHSLRCLRWRKFLSALKRMCGRYRRTTSDEELARHYHIPIPSQTDLPISYNIAPSQKVLTIRFNPEARARSLDALQWGLIPYWAKDPKIAYRTINARAETAIKRRRSARR